MHGDLKPANILIFDNENGTFVPKLSDFSFSTDVRSPDVQILGGTEYWNAPECSEYAPASVRAVCNRPARDVYSLGLVFWTVFYENHPFYGTPAEVQEGGELARKLYDLKMGDFLADKLEEDPPNVSGNPLHSVLYGSH